MSVDATDRKLLARVQGDLPLSRRPFAEIAMELGLDEEEVLRILQTVRPRVGT